MAQSLCGCAVPVDKHELNRQSSLEGTCISIFSCFFDGSSSSEHHQDLLDKRTTSTKRDSIAPFAESDTGSDQELLDDLELVLEGRGLISTIFLPSKGVSEGTSSSVPRTAFIRCKRGESKIECQVVTDNTVVTNGTLKRFKFSALDVSKVSKGRDKNSLIPAVVDDDLVMRFTILKKGELHFVFESQHVRDDIVQGFKLFIAKKKSSVTNSKVKTVDEVGKEENKEEEKDTLPEDIRPPSPSDCESSSAFFPYDSSNRLLNKSVVIQQN